MKNFEASQNHSLYSDVSVVVDVAVVVTYGQRVSKVPNIFVDSSDNNCCFRPWDDHEELCRSKSML